MSTVHMGYTVGHRVEQRKAGTLVSVCVRLHQLYGDSPTTWEHRMCGATSDYKQVARMNRELIRSGLTEKVAELLAPIDASLMGEEVPLFQAVQNEQQADRAEDACGDAFLVSLAQGSVPVAEAHQWIKRSAASRFHAERCEAAVARWIEEQKVK